MRKVHTSLLVIGFLMLSAGLTLAQSNPPAPLRPLPPPRPECTPVAGKQNTWLCDGPAVEEPLEADEQEMVDFVTTRHRDFRLPRDGATVDTDEIPRQYIDEFRRSKNANYGKKIDGYTSQQLSDLLDQNLSSLMRVRGFAGAGIDANGIFVEAQTSHGSFPGALSGAKVRVLPASTRAKWMGQTATIPIRPLVSGILIGKIISPTVAGCTLSGAVVGLGIPLLFWPAHCLPYPFCTSWPSNTNLRIPGNIFAFQPYDGAISLGPDADRSQLTQPGIYNPQDPTTPATYPYIGWMAGWENMAVHIYQGPPGLNTPGTDLAVAYIDNNLRERDASIAMELVPAKHIPDPDQPEFEGKLYRSGKTNKKIKGVVGAEAVPVGMSITVYTDDIRNTGVFEVEGTVTHSNYTVLRAGGPCGDVQIEFLSAGNVQIEVTSRAINPGDSGAPIVTNGKDGMWPDGFLLGYLTWAKADIEGSDTGHIAGGETYNKIKEGLKIDNQSAPLKTGEIRKQTQIFTKWTTQLEVHNRNTAIVAAKAGTQACGFLEVHNPGRKRVTRVRVEGGLSVGAPADAFLYFNPANQLNTPFILGPNETATVRACYANTKPLSTFRSRVRVYGDNALSPTIRDGFNTFGAVFTATAPPSFQVEAFNSFGAPPDVHVNQPGDQGWYFVQVQNVGAEGDATIIPAVDYGGTGTALPLLAEICEEDVFNVSGQRICSLGLTPNLTKHFKQGEFRYFFVVLTRTGAAIPLDHYYNRVGTKVVVGGQIYGEASLSVTTVN